RLDAFDGFLLGFIERDALRESLNSVYDLERHAGRVAYGNVNVRDLIQLKQSLEKIPELNSVLTQFDKKKITELSNKLSFPENLTSLLSLSLQEDPPVSITEGSIIKDGYHEKLHT